MKIVLRFNIVIAVTAFFLTVIGNKAIGQLSLGATSPYKETFDNIGNGLPGGFTIRTNVTATSLGDTSELISAATGWANTGKGFKNFASGTDNVATQTTDDQKSVTNRVLGLRQTGAFGDPGAGFTFQVANTIGRAAFRLTFKLQSLDVSAPRKATWFVEYGIGNVPTSFSAPVAVTGDLTTGDSSFTNAEIAVDFGNALDNINDIVTIRIVTLSATTGSGNRPSTGIDDFELEWTPTDPNAAALLAKDGAGLNLTKLDYPTTTLGSPRDSSFLLSGSNLTGDVTLKVSGSAFQLSQSGIDYGDSVLVPKTEANNKKIFVRFDPLDAGEYRENLTASSTGATSIDIPLKGVGYDPKVTEYSFNTCTDMGEPGDGFTQYSVLGDAQLWTCTTFGRNNTNGVNINGYASGAQSNDDWLISPMITKTFEQIPVLSFYSRGEFNGPPPSVWISTDYNGVGNPEDYTWTNLMADFPATSNTWTLTDNIDLSAYKGKPFYIGFKYISSATEGAARWTLDDISIEDRSKLFSVTPVQNDFGNIAVASASASRKMKLRSVGYGAITITAPRDFELSKDSASYSKSLVLSEADAQAGLEFYVRFVPQIKSLSIVDSLHFTGAVELDSYIVQLTGSSYPHDETFDVAAYNLSFFASSGTEAIVRSKQQIDQQMLNIKAVLRQMDADVISFEEMSSDDSLKSMLTALNAETGKNYKSFISDFWSHMESTDPNYPPQKIGFIYNADIATPDPETPPRAMFNEGFTAGSVYSSDFWASGRLPFMATFIVDVQGIKQKIRMIVIHGKAGSDIDSYNRRMSDLQVLHDSLADSQYKNDNLFIMGDFNDRLSTSIATGQPSSYQMFVEDQAYAKLTYAMDTSGIVSFINGGDGVIDNILFRKGQSVSKQNVIAGGGLKIDASRLKPGQQILNNYTTAGSLKPTYKQSGSSGQITKLDQVAANSTGLAAADDGVVYLDSTVTVLDPRSYISPYDKIVASDHLPVFARFNLLTSDISLPVGLFDLQAISVGGAVRLNWKTGSELNTQQFIIERSVDGLHFEQIGRLPAAGNSSTTLQYQFEDRDPAAGSNYYRVEEKMQSGQSVYTAVISLDYQQGGIQNKLQLIPNPVHNHIQIKVQAVSDRLQAAIYNMAGIQVLTASGSLMEINKQVNSNLQSLATGIYFIRLRDSQQSYQGKFMKY